MKWYYTVPVAVKKAYSGTGRSGKHRTHAVCDYCKDIIITVYKGVEVLES